MTISELNSFSDPVVGDALERCCGSSTWVRNMLAARPFADEADLHAKADACWAACTASDALEAFSHHPKIGGSREELEKKFGSTSAWASGEQANVKFASSDVLQALADGNTAYADKFGYIFIVCATGKSAPEMLHLLQERLPNSPEAELPIAMAEQLKITHIRLEKLLNA